MSNKRYSRSRRKDRASSAVAWLAGAAGAGVFVILAVALVTIYGGARSGQSGGSSKGNLGAGSVASAFSLPAVNGRTVSLSDYLGSKNVLLFLNEGVM